jgi:hypothetical protein
MHLVVIAVAFILGVAVGWKFPSPAWVQKILGNGSKATTAVVAPASNTAAANTVSK